ncbi:hypothetical protein CB1_012719007 [Camelus ferus]|nr:hypothetical protein CB1_012719007 [Camelus ferus]
MPFKRPSYPVVKRYNQNRIHLQKLWREERYLRNSRKHQALRGTKEKEASVTPNPPEKAVDSQGPRPVCTPTFPEKQKSGADAMTEDKDEEITSSSPCLVVQERRHQRLRHLHVQRNKEEEKPISDSQCSSPEICDFTCIELDKWNAASNKIFGGKNCRFKSTRRTV